MMNVIFFFFFFFLRSSLSFSATIAESTDTDRKTLHIYYTHGINQIVTSVNKDVGYIKKILNEKQRKYFEYPCPILRYRNFILLDVPKNLKNTDLPFAYTHLQKAFINTGSIDFYISSDSIITSNYQSSEEINDFIEKVRTETFHLYNFVDGKKIKASIGKITVYSTELTAIKLDDTFLTNGPSPWEIRSARCIDLQNNNSNRIFVIPHQYGGTEKKSAFFHSLLNKENDDTLSINLGGWGNEDGLHTLLEQPQIFDVLLLGKELFGSDFFFSSKPSLEKKLLSSNFIMPEMKKPHIEEPGILPFLSRWLHQHPVFVRQLPKYNIPKPWTIINKNNIRIGILGITDPKTKQETDFDNGLSFDIAEPIDILQQNIYQIRPYVDLVLVISNADNTANSEYQLRLNGVDIFLGNVGNAYRQENSTPNNFSVYAPVLPKYSSVGHVEITLSRSYSQKYLIHSVHHDSLALNESFMPPTSNFISMETQKNYYSPEFVLPSANEVPNIIDNTGSDNTITTTIPLNNIDLEIHNQHFDDKSFFRLVTNLMLKYTKAELSIGFPYRRDNIVISSVDSEQLKSWFKQFDEVILIHCRGQYLQELIKKTEKDYPYAGFHHDLLKDHETYSVATSTFFMNDRNFFEILHTCYIDDNFKRVSMSDFVNWALLELKKENLADFSSSNLNQKNYLLELSYLLNNKYVKRKHQWRIEFNELSISFQQSFYKNQDDYMKVSNDKITGNAQETLGGSYNIRSITPIKDYLFELGSKANYTITHIDDKIFGTLSNNLEDDLRFHGQAAYLFLQFSELFWMQAAGLAVQTEYDTEITPAENQTRQEILRFVPGVKLSEGNTVKDVLLGAVFQYDLAQKQRIFPKPGFNISSEIEKNLSDFLQYKGFVEFRYLPDRENLSDNELFFELGIDSSFLIKVSPSLAIAPTLNFYMYRGDQSQKTGFYSLFGVAFGYSKTWKPHIHPIYR